MTQGGFLSRCFSTMNDDSTKSDPGSHSSNGVNPAAKAVQKP